MRWPNLNKTEQILVCIVIFLALGSLLYQFAITPELRHVRMTRFQLGFQQGLLNTKMAEAQYRDALNNRIVKLRAEMTQTKRSLFNDHEARDFLRSLSQLIGQTGNALMTITPHDMQDIPSEDTGSFMTMPVRITINGDYGEIIRFLDQLQIYGQLTTVSKLRIATAQDLSEVNAELTLNLYVHED